MSLSNKPLKHIVALFKARIPDRLKSLKEEKTRLLRKAASLGATRSSYVTNGIFKLCSQELEILIAFAWQDIKRVISNLRVPSNELLASDLKETVRSLLSSPYAEITKLYEEWIKPQQTTARNLEPALENAYAKVDAEIDLFVDSLLQLSSKLQSPSSVIVQGNAQVGAILASPGASAQVTQNIISDNQKLILEALDRVLEGIQNSVKSSELTDVHELAEDVKSEIVKDKPNYLKVKSAIVGIGAAINTLANLKPAYEYLKGTAAIIGITLP
jgi:hypothetical protein